MKCSNFRSQLKIFCLVIMLSLISCHKDSPPPNSTGINPNIQLLIGDMHNVIPNSPCAVWSSNNVIYTVYPLAYCTISSEMRPLTYTLLEYNDIRYIELSPDERKLMIIRPIFGDLSFGKLCEYDVSSNKENLLFDSTYNISSARYYRDNNHIIFYSYGHPFGTKSGYYLFDKISGDTNLLLAYFPPAGLSEYLNGFDVHPLKPILIIPIVSYSKSPIIVEYNFESNSRDTLNTSFDFSFNRICLWLRYNHTGDKILYSCYPRYSGGDAPGDDSEIGIIDRKSMVRKILNVNTYINGRSVNICPHWSPDENNILYSSAMLKNDGEKGLYNIYILKDLNDQ